jgi:hypothetical protein
LATRRASLPAVVLLALLSLTAVQACGAGERAAQPARVAGIELSDQELRLAEFESVPGTKHLFAPLVPTSSFASYDSHGYASAKDLLFFDATQRSARWLLGDPSHRLRFYQLIVDPALEPYWNAQRVVDGAARRSLGVLFEAVPDPLKEQVAEQASIGFAAPDGTDRKTLISGVSGFLGHHLVDQETLIIFYVREGELWAADVEPATRTIRSDSRVSAAPPPPTRE